MNVLIKTILEIQGTVSIYNGTTIVEAPKSAKISILYKEKGPNSTSILRIDFRKKLINIPITRNVRSISKNFIGSGKCSISFRERDRIVPISNSDPEVLRLFVDLIKELGEGRKLMELKNRETFQEKKPTLEPASSSTKAILLGSKYGGEYIENAFKNQNISNLIFEDCKFSVLTIGLNMQNLTTLTISSLRSLTYIPAFVFENLPNLESLCLTKNSLCFLPYTIGKCINLRVVNLSHNNLFGIPYTLGKLKRLSHLDVSYNKLCDLPLSFSMPRLEVLELSYNKFHDGSVFRNNIYIGIRPLSELALNVFLKTECFKNKMIDIPCQILLFAFHDKRECHRCGCITHDYNEMDHLTYSFAKLANQVHRGPNEYLTDFLKLNLIYCTNCMPKTA